MCRSKAYRGFESLTLRQLKPPPGGFFCWRRVRDSKSLNHRVSFWPGETARGAVGPGTESRVIRAAGRDAAQQWPWRESRSLTLRQLKPPPGGFFCWRSVRDSQSQPAEQVRAEGAWTVRVRAPPPPDRPEGRGRWVLGITPRPGGDLNTWTFHQCRFCHTLPIPTEFRPGRH